MPTCELRCGFYQISFYLLGFFMLKEVLYMYDRLIKLIGTEKFNELRKKKVLLIGLGGVGGYALEALVRSGLGTIIIIDYDTIDITNLNRQIITNNSNIGLKKVDEAYIRAKSIDNDINIIKHDTYLDKDNIDKYITSDIDYVIDACDSIHTKEAIIIKCLQNKIKFISSMGTANKFKPELLTITDLRKTSYDKLAKKLRTFVIKNHITGKIPVVSSTEEVQKVSGLGSTSFVPATAGLMCASYVINDIINT